MNMLSPIIFQDSFLGPCIVFFADVDICWVVRPSKEVRLQWPPEGERAFKQTFKRGQDCKQDSLQARNSLCLSRSLALCKNDSTKNFAHKMNPANYASGFRGNP